MPTPSPAGEETPDENSSLRVLEKNGFERAEVFVEDGIESAYYQKDVEGAG